MSDSYEFATHTTKGGKARAEKLSAKKRSEIAKKGARARWHAWAKG